MYTYNDVNNFSNVSAFAGTNPVSGYYPDEFEKQALDAINYERAQWDDAAVFVTERESYLMRRVVERARRYYHGIFENAKDEITGEDKTWVPLTEWSVESVVKSIDLDTKDIIVQPGTPESVNVAPVIRALIQNLFKKIGFGQLLNDLTRAMARDGTVVVKSYIDIDPHTKKKVVRSTIVNLLNIWCDPSARTLEDTSVIERSVKSEFDLQAYDGVWDNLQYVSFSLNVPQIDRLFNIAGTGKLPYTEIWERWGKIRKSWVTKDHSDDDTWVEGHIVASGISRAQVIHKIRENPRKDGHKPYQEAWYRRIDGRWYGRGVAEMLFGLQEYTNMTVNIRKSNNMVLQNGIFLIRKGSGITPDMISSITAGGGLPVTNIENDVKQLPVQDFRQSSYTDEDRAYAMADRVTGSFDINRGEAGRASASATASLQRDRNIRDTFVLVQEGMGFFIEDLIVHHYIPLLKEILSQKEVIRIVGDADFLAFIDEQVVNSRVNDYIDGYITETGFYPTPDELQHFAEAQNKYLKAMGKQRFVKYFNGMFDEEIDIDVQVTDEKFNRVVAVQQLRDTLIAYSRLPVASKLDSDAVLREMFNLMGIEGEFFLERPQLPATAMNTAQMGRQLKALPQGLPTEQGQFQNASGMNAQGPAQGLPAGGAGGPAGGTPFQTQLRIAAPLTPVPVIQSL